jgi:hypothetical protein
MIAWRSKQMPGNKTAEDIDSSLYVNRAVKVYTVNTLPVNSAERILNESINYHKICPH